MNHDPTSLDNLHDIVAPPPVPLWPPAPGWYVVMVIVAILLVVLFLRWFRHYRANAYRRAALAELKSLSTAKTPSARVLAELLKRTALAAYPREEVAGLSGNAWLAWLETAGRFAAPPPVRQTLTVDLYRPGATTDTAALRDYVAQWIKRHHSNH